MNISGAMFRNNTSLAMPFSNQNKDTSESRKTTIQAAELQANQMKNKEDHRLKYFNNQMDKLKESLQKVRENEKLSREEKQRQIEGIQKQMQDMQQQLAEYQRTMQEKEIKEQQEKKEKEEAKHLTAEEHEKKAHAAQQQMLAGIAVAASNVQEAHVPYSKVKEYTNQAKLTMGSKFGGNASAAQTAALFEEASKYGRMMMKELTEANEGIKSTHKAIEAYEKHKKRAEDKKEIQEQQEVQNEI